MKLRTRLPDEKTSRAITCPGLRAPFLAFALFSGGCVFNPQGLPALPDAQGKDGRQDSGIADRSPEKSRKDFISAESPAWADFRPDTDINRDSGKHDSTHKDKAVPDSAKKDISPGDAMADAKTACLSASTGTFSGYVTFGTPQVVGGYSFDYLGKSGSDALLDISCSGKATVSAQKCPIGLATTVNVAADGKKITIVPVSANATVVNVSITVGAI